MGFARSILTRMFGRPKGVPGRLGGIIMARTNGEAAAEAIDVLDVRPDDKVLEIGFGPGVGIRLLAARMPAGYVAGIDPSSEMVDQAAARNAEAVRGGRVDLRRGSVATLPFPDETFDKAIAINSMQVWPDAVSGLREVRRVLKPGGIVVLGFTVHSGQARDGATESLAAAGFTDARIVERKALFCALASRGARSDTYDP
jgi:ubiquinone/menaquinone biosynthesis C-methylase UbiE